MEILIILILILLNGIFSMSEIALVSAKKFKLELAGKRGSIGAQKALQLAGNPNRFLSTVQIGITLIGILTGIYSGEKITSRLKAFLVGIGIDGNFADSLAVLLVVVMVTFFSIVFGELLPKRIGLLYPEKIASLVAAPMNLISKIAAPFIWLLTVTNNLFLKLFGLREDSESRITEEEIKAIVQQGAEYGEIKSIEHDIVDRVFALGDRRVSELMTHSRDILWIDVSEGIDAIREKLKQGLHSVYPVADGSLDKLEGVVNVKEIFATGLPAEDFALQQFIRKPLIVHENTLAYLVLEDFRQARQHHAIVVDEYGAVQGIVSMDDMLNALVGDVSEKHQADYQITKRDDNSWLVDGRYPYFELLNYFDISDDNSVDDGHDFNTIAGLVLHQAGRIPKVGEKLFWKQFELEVVDMDGLRVDKVLISQKAS